MHVLQTGIDNAADDVLTVIEAPSQSDLMMELIKKLKPQVVVTGMAHFEAVTTSAFVHLLDVTREIGSRLFLDISDHFELSSLPSSNGVLKYLAGNSLPSHAAVVCGLVKNQVVHFSTCRYQLFASIKLCLEGLLFDVNAIILQSC